MISTQILIYTIFNTLCGNNVVVHSFIRKALHSLTGARVTSTFSVRIETAAVVFNSKISILVESKTIDVQNYFKMIGFFLDSVSSTVCELN